MNNKGMLVFNEWLQMMTGKYNSKVNGKKLKEQIKTQCKTYQSKRFAKTYKNTKLAYDTNCVPYIHIKNTSINNISSLVT